jgi:acyl-CoA synthetase (AMP-forming)/AMP-acid ligase II
VRDEEIVTYGNLAQRIAELSLGFRRQGFQIGDRVVVLFPLCTDFYAVVLALLASGMTAVLIDSGMGSRRIRQALKTARAQGIVTVHALLKYRFVLPLLWAIPKKFSRDTRGIFMRPFQTLEGYKDPAFRYVPRDPDDEALITFTSGSTGQPKGVDRTHGLLTAQHLALRQHFPDDPGQVDMPCFPVVALHNLCCGNTTVMPPVDLRAPSWVNPSAVLSQVTKWKVSSMSGAPAYIKRIAEHLLYTGRRIPTLRRMAVGGAPASVSLCRKILQAFPGIEASVVYGSTEAEPISSVSMESVIQSEADGFLVGKPARMADVALVNLPEPPPILDRRDLEPYGVAPGEVGELVVRGPHISRRYIQDPEANRACKLQSINGGVWHRTGDLARFDANRDLWLVGRLADVVRHSGRTLYPLMVEAAIDSLPGIKTSALVTHAARPNGELAVEPENEANRKTLPAVLIWLKEHDLASLPVRVVQKIPVDGRHNSKVDRPTLRKNLEIMHRVMAR